MLSQHFEKYNSKKRRINVPPVNIFQKSLSMIRKMNKQRTERTCLLFLFNECDANNNAVALVEFTYNIQ